MSRTRLAILGNEVAEDHLMWIRACDELLNSVEPTVIDLTGSDWLDRVRGGHFEGLLALPGGWSTAYKTLYDERTRILASALHIPIFPSLDEILIYENKKYLSYWLQAHSIPHPRTRVFYHENEALEFIGRAAVPIVAKTNVGGGGDGVRILHQQEDARQYVRRTFSGKGANRSVGPKWRKKGFVGRVAKRLLEPAAFKARIDQYRMLRSEVQKDFVLLQEFIPHEFEWRVVRIGDSFFAHKKLKKGELASGSLLKEYGNPPLALLDLVKEITDVHGFRSQAVDLFETQDGRYLVNEMQCIFGQSDPYQMLVDEVPGRYRYLDNAWVFEAGDFNRHESFLLRLEYFLSTLQQHQPNV